MIDHPDNRTPWWGYLNDRPPLMTDHPVERPPWWETMLMIPTLMTDHPDDRPCWWYQPWWQTTPDDTPPWWKTILMRCAFKSTLSKPFPFVFPWRIIPDKGPPLFQSHLYSVFRVVFNKGVPLYSNVSHIFHTGLFYCTILDTYLGKLLKELALSKHILSQRWGGSN